MNHRIQKLASLLSSAQVEALVVSHPVNVHYLFGTGISENLDVVGIIGENGYRVVTDSRYWEHLGRLGWKEIVRVDARLPRPQAIAQAIHELSARRVGLEAAHVSLADLKDWNKPARKLQVKYKPVTGLVEGLRLIKDEGEVAKIRHAARIADEAFAYFCAQVRPGMTEKEGAWMLESFMRTHGADAIGFDPIVAGGPNAALPHAIPTDRKIETGEPLTLDFGASVEGYKSDLTRTICLGTPPAEFTRVYNIVLAAQKRAEKRIRSGVKGKKADAYARRVIEKAGHGEHFGHGTGHGVGLSVHEGPRASRTSKDVLQEGSTLTVEPGIYIPGWGGVRIEDLGIVRRDDFEVLSHASKDPVIRL